MPQKYERRPVVDSWRYRRRVGSSLARTRQTGACVTGTCRDDPIPPGVYWIDIPWEDSLQTPGIPKPQHFQLWLEAMQALHWVKLLKTVHHDSALIGDEPARDWHLFEVVSPAPRWSTMTGLGLPTVAPSGSSTDESDTVQRPPPEAGQSWWDTIGPLGKVVVVSVGLGAGALIVYGLVNQ